MSKDEQKGEAWAGAGQGEAFSGQPDMSGQGYGQQNPLGQANVMGQPQFMGQPPMGQYGYQPQFAPQYQPQYQYMGQSFQPQGQPQYQYMGQGFQPQGQPQFMGQYGYQPQFAPQYQPMGQPGMNQPQAETASQTQGQPQYQYMGQGFQPQGQYMGQPFMMGQGFQPQAGQAYFGQSFAGQSFAGQAEGHDDHDKLHDKNQFGQQNGPDMGQMYGMMQDVIKGDADPGKIMSFLQASGGDFWKGALVGAAAVLLLTNGAVKDALAGVMGSMFGQQGADETGAEHAPETGEA